MNRFVHLIAIAALGAGLSFTRCAAADNAEEARLLTVLASAATPSEKDAACIRLKVIGTEACIPALQKLLADDGLSHPARNALETLPFRGATVALCEGLKATGGSLRLGIINSLGHRADPAAASALTALLPADDATTVAVLDALGRIGGPDTPAILLRSLDSTTPAVHAVAADALLRLASTPAGLPRADSEKICRRLMAADEPARVRTGAYEALIRNSDPATAMKSVVAGSRGSDVPLRMASLEAARRVPGDPAALSGLLPEVSPPVQAGLIEALAQRGDASIAPAIIPCLNSSDSPVRLAAADALRVLGHPASVPALAKAAVQASGGDQKAIRLALALVNAPGIDEAFARELQRASPPEQAELVRALGARAEHTAVPLLLGLTSASAANVRQAAFDSLALLIQPGETRLLVAALSSAGNSQIRSDAAEGLKAALIRLKNRSPDLEPIVAAVSSGSKETRLALLPVCSLLAQAEIRSALRAALKDADPDLRRAAIQAVCDTEDPELLPDLEALAAGSGEPARNQAIRACVRLCSESPAIPPASRLKTLQALLAQCRNAEEKKLVLSGLGATADAGALGLIGPLLADRSVETEAALAMLIVATNLGPAQAATALAALDRLSDLAAQPAVQAKAMQAADAMRAESAYLTQWQACGPFRVEGKAYNDLFEMKFGPEAGDAKWEPLAAGADPQRPYVMDLLKKWPGEQCVAYARTYIHSDKAGPARLELGSDDGVKVWLNGEVVHANNCARPLQPGSDPVDIQLKAGWNELQLKVTQNNLPWAFSARILERNGRPLRGVRSAATPGS